MVPVRVIISAATAMVVIAAAISKSTAEAKASIKARVRPVKATVRIISAANDYGRRSDHHVDIRAWCRIAVILILLVLLLLVCLQAVGTA